MTKTKVGRRRPPERSSFNGVPHAVLIGREGKVLWVGHPLSNDGKDLASHIEEALK